MKELSIEEKAKRYDEIIERAKNTIEVNQTIPDIVECVESLIPELKESEDNKTKRMLDIITYKMSQHQPDIFNGEENEWFNTWLEKQRDKDEEILILKDQIESLHAAIKAIKETHRIELEKQREQKPADTEKGAKGNDREIPISSWGEADEKMWTQVINEIEAIKSNSSTVFEKNIAQDKINWLKSLKERVQQQQQEWSKEDDYNYGIIQYILNNECVGIADKKIAINWFKFLKERYTWKPSDEQMEMLENVRKILHTNEDIYSKANHFMYNFEELIRTLKKLRNESYRTYQETC